MAQESGMKQPVLGVLATVIVVFLSLAVILWFDVQAFGTWVSFIAMASIPAGVIMSLVWQNNYPAPAATLQQPMKGIYLLFFSFLIALIVASWSLRLVGGFLRPPTPFVIMFIITSVITTIWMVTIWQCWPMTMLGKHPAWVGLGTLVLAYVVSWIIFRNFYDFSSMKGAPFYAANLDPHGLFNAWAFLAYWVAFVCINLFLVEFDFWPLTAMAKAAPVLGKQPIFGIIGTVLTAVVTYVVFYFFVVYTGMDVVRFMVKVMIATIFGQFIMLMMFQTSPFQTIGQPLKGFLLLLVTVLVGQIMIYVYQLFSILIAGGLHSGPPTYDLELWLASALLAVTFPLMVIYSNFFGYWPLSEYSQASMTEEERKAA